MPVVVWSLNATAFGTMTSACADFSGSYGSGLFERLAGGALWLRHGRRWRSLSFGRRFRDDDSP